MDGCGPFCYVVSCEGQEQERRHTPYREMTKTILIADDSAQVRKYVGRILRENQEFETCKEAVNGLDALVKARECNPDLIILDLGMPVMNGLETARELKRVMPIVPIILFTLHGDVVSDKQASSSGIDLVIAKSDISKLSEHVRSLLQLN
jgi:DNA-binding NarL/FixJ family response regulator